jgi:selenocysteine lyase/cysteine desulfurase
MPALSHADIRALFPIFSHTSTAILDNAAGSQLPRCVIDAAVDYMSRAYLNTGMATPESQRVSATLDRARATVRTFLNGDAIGSVVLGGSSTASCFLLANAYADAMESTRAGSLATGEPLPDATRAMNLSRRNQVIVSTAGHEANINPWMRLARRGFDVTLWPTERDTDGNHRPLLSTLNRLLSDRTLLVAMPQVSNILGESWDMKIYTDAAHAAGARMVVDGVASAPHAAPDVAHIGCDWYLYSTYKVFGPHLGALFGAHKAFSEVTGPNHFFIPRDELPRKFEPGGVNHEGCAMICALWDFVCQVEGTASTTPPRHEVFANAFARMLERERALAGRVLAFLAKHPRIKVVGPTTMDHRRIGLLSFVHATKKPSDIAKAGNALGLGFRSGHCYAKRLVEELKATYPIDPAEGVVRVSFMGYNSDAEADRLLNFLEHAL